MAPGNGSTTTHLAQRIDATPAARPVAEMMNPGTDVAISSSSAAVAVAERARALVQARILMARYAPRDVDHARVRLMKDCKRPGFAKAARYSKPVSSGKVTGPSIRFAEAALRAFGNVDTEMTVVMEDDRRRIVRVSVIDLEANAAFSSDLVIEKTVERTALKPGQLPIAQRVNSAGKLTYLVEATEDDMMVKQNAAVSKAIRNAALRLIPADIVEECMVVVDKVVRNSAAEDPDAERKKIIDSFVGVGVGPADIKKYLGQDLATCSPAQLQALFEVFCGIRDGETTWKEVMAAKAEEDPATADPPKRPGKTKADRVPTADLAGEALIAAVNTERQQLGGPEWMDLCVSVGADVGDWNTRGDALCRKLLGLLRGEAVETGSEG